MSLPGADAGKSTIGGQIMKLTGQVDERTLERYEKEAKEANRESWYGCGSIQLVHIVGVGLVKTGGIRDFGASIMECASGGWRGFM